MITFTSYGIIALALLAALHYVYEAILAPSFRTHLKYQLYTLRDEARDLKLIHGKVFQDESFDCLESMIVTAIRRVDSFNISMAYDMKQAYESNQSLRELVKKRTRQVDDCSVPKARDIGAECARIYRLMLFVNTGTWFFYLIPLITTVACGRKIAQLSKSVMCTSDNDVNRAHIKMRERAHIA